MFKKNEFVTVKIIAIENDCIRVKERKTNITSEISLSEIYWNHQMLFDGLKFHIGDEMDAIVILHTDCDLYLSLKRVKANPFILFSNENDIKSIIPVKPVKMFDFGMIVKTQEGIHGIVHKNDIPNSYELNFDTIDLILINKDKEKSRLLFSF